MKYEVEQKFRVDEHESIAQQLEQWGAAFGGVDEQIDRYFAHPQRDFAASDEALRIRRVGFDCCITYKGPKIDSTTKTRREIELPLPAGRDTVEQFTELLEALGFRRVAEVCKRRRKAMIARHGARVEVALDNVAGVGKFVELELPAQPDELETAKRQVVQLAAELGLSQSERRSYLELLLES
jgi:adenylate cyclase class 2